MKSEIKKESLLITSLKKGDTAALEKIIEDFSGYVCTVIRNFSRGSLTESDMEEAAADVFIKLWQNRKNIDPECGLKPYISAIARNNVKNRFRSMSPLTEDIDEIETASPFDIAETAEMSQLFYCLEQGIKKVSKKQREIFLRFYFYGEKTSEIGQKMNLKESTVRSELTRTRAKLKEYLEERGFDYV